MQRTGKGASHAKTQQLSVLQIVAHMAMGQKPVPPVNMSNPRYKRLKRVVHLPQNGNIGFD